MFKLNKKKIFLLYRYYLFEERTLIESFDEKETIEWLDECLHKEVFLKGVLDRSLKSNQKFYFLPPLEKAILIFTIYELSRSENLSYSNAIIDQSINFSKSYLDVNKYKYINKILDTSYKYLRGKFD